MTAPVPVSRPDRWCAQYLFAYDIDDAKLDVPCAPAWSSDDFSPAVNCCWSHRQPRL